MVNRVASFFDDEHVRENNERLAQPLPDDEQTRVFDKLARHAEVELSWMSHRDAHDIHAYERKRTFLMHQMHLLEMEIRRLNKQGIRGQSEEARIRTGHLCFLESKLHDLRIAIQHLEKDPCGALIERRGYYRRILDECIPAEMLN